MGLRGYLSAALQPRGAKADLGAKTNTLAGEAQGNSRWDWARNWELWLALAVGAFLRFWRLDLSSFLLDQAVVMQLARTAVLNHLFPVTSVTYSIGLYIPPLSLDLALPFALFTSDPFPAIVSIAVWSVLGIALCYWFALKYFGRWVAAVGTLLFATCGVAVNYSRFIWQPNYEPTFLALWALALFAWCIGGRRGWFAVSVTLLLLIIEIHPVAVSLIPIMVVAWFMAPRRPGRREYAALAVVVLVILSPTLLWEAVTHGLDFHQLFQISGQTPTYNLTVLHILYATIGTHGSAGLGADSLYERFTKLYSITNFVAALFLLAGYAILAWGVIAPAVRAWRVDATEASPSPRVTRRIATWWGTLRADRRWCVEALLLLWVTLPPLSMIRHSSPPAVHYLLITYPALFLVAAYPIRWLYEVDALGWLARRPLSGLFSARVVSFLGVGIVALLIVAQTAQSALIPASLVSPGFQALQFYGYPLGSVQAAEAQISDLQQRQNASALYFSLPANERLRVGMDYLLVGEHSDRISSADNCLVLPPPSATPSLVVTTTPGSPAATLLPQIAEAQHVADVPILGGEPFHVYQVNGAISPVASDVAVPPATYHPTPDDALQLDDAALDPNGMLRLRWTVLVSLITPAAPEVYTIQARTPQGIPTTLGSVMCQPTRWQEGATVYTWIPLSAATTSLPAAISLTLSASAPALYEPQVGPLHLLSGRSINTTPVTVEATGAPASGDTPTTSGVAPDGSYYLSLANLG